MVQVSILDFEAVPALDLLLEEMCSIDKLKNILDLFHQKLENVSISARLLESLKKSFLKYLAQVSEEW